MRNALLLIAAAGVLAASQLPPEIVQLSRIERKVQALLAGIPDYTCLETIERSERKSAAERFKPIDTVRLEVGQAGKKEVFSWPGARQFDERNASALVGSGAMSSGEFATLLGAIFTGGRAVVKWHGREEINGRAALRYDYHLSLFAHVWQVTVGGRAGDVATSGSFWADAETLDLLRVEANAAEIPADLTLRSLVSRVDYGRFRIRDSDVFLPQSALVVLAERNGHESRNLIEFSHCRQYASESAVSFTDAPAAAAGPAHKAAIEIPAGLPLEIELTSGIDSKTAMVGDLVRAQLRNRAGAIPAGAAVSGRIRRLDRRTEPSPHFVVGLEFSEIESGGGQARFFGRLQSIAPVPGLSWILSTSKTTTGNFRDFRTVNTEGENITPRELPGVGTFFMTGTSFRLPAGLRMIWMTEALPRSGNN